MMNDLVRLETAGDVSTITMNNPKTRNALSRAMILELASKIEQLMGSRECRAIVLTGASGTFCSGGDISGMTEDRQVLDSRAWMNQAHRLIRSIVNGEKPVIAAVEGYAFGAGLSLATGADYVVASDAAKFCAAFAKVGLVPDMGLFWTLSQRCGIGEAKRLIMLALTLEASEAKSLGLVDQIVPAGAALEEAQKMAEAYAAAAPLPVALTKAVFARGCSTLDDALQAEVDYQPMLFLSEDHMAAVRAFREKQKPVFRGR
jgi:2-(1,2-epoxy-1,2-dihydrophenyl)acetyl-CoA isomerase